MNQVQSGASLTTLLTVLFIALKLTHVIAWSWVWVLAPLWISALATATILILAVLWMWGAER